MDASVWTYWALVAGGIAVAFYAVAPILIKFSQRTQAWPEFTPLVDEQLPEVARAFVGRTVRALTAEGFRAVESVRNVGMVPNVIAFIVILVHAETGETAGITATATPFSFIRAATYEFGTRYRDGTRLV